MNSFFYCCSCVMMIRQKENYLKHVYVNTVKYIVLTCFMAAIFSAKVISRIYNNVYSPMVMSHKYISYSLFDKFVANLIKFLNLFLVTFFNLRIILLSSPEPIAKVQVLLHFCIFVTFHKLTVSFFQTFDDSVTAKCIQKLRKSFGIRCRTRS